MPRKLKANSTSVVENSTSEGDDVLDIVSITVSIGEEVYSPVQYQSFRVGGHSMTFNVKPGSNVEDQIERATGMLAELVEQEFDVRFRKFGERIKRSSTR